MFARGARQGGFKATFYLARATHLVVVADAAGYFVTGYQLSGRQVRHLLRTGTLGGGP